MLTRARTKSRRIDFQQDAVSSQLQAAELNVRIQSSGIRVQAIGELDAPASIRMNYHRSNCNFSISFTGQQNAPPITIIRNPASVSTLCAPHSAFET
jgi:hypothetical protein